MFKKIIEWLKIKYNEIFFIGCDDKLPPPLSREEELHYLTLYKTGDESAKEVLIEHNLRLVVFLAKKYESTGYDIEDLVSIGSIGLIKGINTYKIDKNINIVTFKRRTNMASMVSLNDMILVKMIIGKLRYNPERCLFVIVCRYTLGEQNIKEIIA